MDEEQNLLEDNNLPVRRDVPVVAALPRYGVRLASPTDLVGIGLRHWRLMLFAFLATFVGAILAAIVLPDRYTAHLKILVRHERVDQVVTPSADAVRTFSPEGVTDEEIDSEIELIRSQDLLEKLVLTFGLDKKKPNFISAQLNRVVSTHPGIESRQSGSKTEIRCSGRACEKVGFH